VPWLVCGVNEGDKMKKYKCSECGGKLIEEGLSGIYFCDNCKTMFFKNENGNYEKREGVRIK